MNTIVQELDAMRRYVAKHGMTKRLYKRINRFERLLRRYN